MPYAVGMSKAIRSLLFFALFWTSIVGLFDVVIGAALVAGLRSQSFASTDGVVTASEVRMTDGSRSSNYDVDIHYTYQVDGQKFEGSRYGYAQFASSDSEWTRRVVAQNPKGASVRVHYDPANPAESVLVPGIESSGLFMLMFMTPFNVVMLGLWYGVGLPLWHRWQGTSPKLVDWFREAGALHMRLPPLHWVASGLAGIGVAAFAGIFVVAIVAGFHPSMPFVEVMWALVAAVGLGTALYVRRKTLAGGYDLVIRDHEIDLPLGMGQTRRQTIDKASVSSVSVQEMQSGHNKAPHYEIRLMRRDGSHAAVADWYDETEANKLARWLEDQIGIARRA